MRLINAATKRLEEFHGTIPPYAILSHTWGEEEIMFRDMSAADSTEIKRKNGYEKISQLCNRAVKFKLNYAWIDTCCIDKSSSAELSEAINSMYQWYKNSYICFAYLVDVHVTPSEVSFKQTYSKSRWFTRGWCLQELIAPRRVIFLNSMWALLGSKWTFQPLITEITGIDRKSLLEPNLPTISVAQRMSWASKRQTTRIEDIAYCLLGIFDVNMPLLYGEGERAFIRLQEEILREIDDTSIFAWSFGEHDLDDSIIGFSSLATHPSQFRDSADIRSHPTHWGPYSVTNKGIQIQLPLNKYRRPDTFFAVLGCHKEGDLFNSVGLRIRKVINEDNQYVRSPGSPLVVSAEGVAKMELRTIFLSKRNRAAEIIRPSPKCWIRTFAKEFNATDPNVRLIRALPKGAWNSTDGVMTLGGRWVGGEAIIACALKNSENGVAVALKLFPLENSASVSLHPLEKRAMVENDRLESQLSRIGAQSRLTAVPATAELELVLGRVSAKVSFEDIRSQRIYVLDIDWRYPSSWPSNALVNEGSRS